jgi:hypothetical protein
MAQGHHLHLRLFLEGVEVPVISASIQCAANTPAAATIQVVATDKVLDLLPRTVVHLFFYDYVEAGTLSLDTESEGRFGDDYVDWFNSRYKLLFMGELTSMQFQKSAGQRAVILQCSDFSNYWDTTFQYNFGGSLFGGRRQAAFIGANSNFFTSPLGHGTGTIARLLNGRSVNFPDLRGLLAGIVRMLEAIGGSYYGKNTFRGANDFTSIAELRLKVLQQITAAEKDDSTAKLFSRKTFMQWMNRSTQGLGKLVSFRGLLKVLFQYVFHEVYPCPVAKFVSAGTRREPRHYSVGLEKSPAFKGFANKAKNALNSCTRARDLFRAWRESKGGTAQKYVKMWLLAEKTVKEVYAQSQVLKLPNTAKTGSMEAMTALHDIRNYSTSPDGRITANWHIEGQKLGTLDRNYRKIYEKWTAAMEALEKITGSRVSQSKKVTVNTQARVNNQIFRPDIFYAPPPRCNVLFPETYDQFDFSRQYLREVSRIELQTHNEILGSDELFNGRYYAPNVEDVRKGAKLSSRKFARLIMDHELYTGIIPMFENMGEVNIYAMRSGKSKKGGAKVGYAQRAVNFQYFKYRFQSRSMSAGGRFNPMVVPGFPCLIIDKPMNVDQLKISALPVAEQTKRLNLRVDPDKLPKRGELLREIVSPQYLGVLAQLNHMVNQEGGRTQYAFMHARVHRESTEFLGVDKAQVSKVIGTATKGQIWAATQSTKPKKGSRGPLGGRVVDVKDVTKSKMGHVYEVMFNKDKTQVRIGSGSRNISQKSQQDFFTESTDPRPTSTGEETFRAYYVKESSPITVKEDADLPIEDVIRPPWVWDGWAVPKISETYTQLFGTTAITDIAGFNVKDESRYFVGEDDAAAAQAEKANVSSGTKKRSDASGTNTRSENLKGANQNQRASLNQEKECTVENSVDFLVRAYSFVKVNNLDVGDFLKSYSWRPVATMVDILGGSDLSINKVTKYKTVVVKKKVSRKKLVPKEVMTYDEYGLPAGMQTIGVEEMVPSTKLVKRKVAFTGYTVDGKEGFHSRAFGDVEDLFGLVSPTVTRVLGLSTNKRKVTARMDVRKRRRDAVRAYVGELTGSRGLLG